MSIQLDSELERRLREAADRAGVAVEGIVQDALMKELAALERSAKRREREDWLRAEMQAAAADPLFVQDNEEVSRGFRYVDAETARMIRDD